MLKEDIAVNTEPKKYKYILNGEVLYFTREELIERERELNIKNNINFSPEGLERDVDRLIIKLNEFGGDPYGHYADCPELHKCFHEAESKGLMIIYR
jgi:hypothetical protein